MRRAGGEAVWEEKGVIGGRLIDVTAVMMRRPGLQEIVILYQLKWDD